MKTTAFIIMTLLLVATVSASSAGFGAQVRVTNTEKEEALTKNFEQFRERYENQLRYGDNASVTLSEEAGNKTRVRVEEHARFLGLFKVVARNEYVVKDDGVVEKQSSNLWRMLERFRVVKVVADGE